MLRRRLAYQQRGRDIELLIQRPDHRQRERALATEDFRRPVLAAEERGDVFLPQSLLFHPEQDGVHRIEGLRNMNRAFS